MTIDTTLEVVMPAMGDSVTEGTVVEWLKGEGDRVAADETVAVISTDKVDAEVPSPAAGTLSRIRVAAGETVSAGTVLADITPGNGGAGTGGANGAADGPGADDATNGSAPLSGRAAADDASAGAGAGGESVTIAMPQMGESVREGVVLEWVKQPGDFVEADETVVEVSTDKVDAEVPSPAAGVLEEILVPVGETVAVGQPMGRLRTGVAAGSRPRPADDGGAPVGARFRVGHERDTLGGGRPRRGARVLARLGQPAWRLCR